MRVVPFAAAWAAATAALVQLPPVARASATAGPGDTVAVTGPSLDELRAAVRAHPGQPGPVVALARALRHAGDPGGALTELRAALPPPPAAGAPELLWEVMRAHVDRREDAAAGEACRRLAKASPAEGHACTAYVHLGRLRAGFALDEVAAAQAADPGCYHARLAEGRARELLLEDEKAEAPLRDAVAERPADAEARVLLGRVLRGLGKGDEALAELREAVRLDPGDPEALYELALGLPPGPASLDLLRRATAVRPSMSDAWLALGQRQLAAGRPGEARVAADAALRAAPASAAALVLAGQVALADGRVSDALAAGRAALKILPSSGPAGLVVADAQARQGELDAAIESYQVAWGLDHRTPDALVHASEACRRGGRDTSARAFGEKATQEFPRWAPGWAAFGDALAARGELAAARDAYRSALAAPEGAIDRDAVARKLAALH
jgi:tetratricopeptide (TPR) repeat protein